MEQSKTIKSLFYPSGEEEGARLARTRKQLDDLAWLMDNYFRIPGINWRFGIDALIGLVPGGGDILTGAIGLLLVIRALQFSLPKVVIVRMILNTVIDFTVGSIPILGDAFDLFWKSNSRNMKLFHRYAGDPQAGTRSHWLFIGGLILGFAALFGLVALGTFYLVWYVMTHWIRM